MSGESSDTEEDALLAEAQALLALPPQAGAALMGDAIDRGDSEQAAANRETAAQLERSGRVLGFPIRIIHDDVHQRTIVYLVLENGELSGFYGEDWGDCVAEAMANLRGKVERLISDSALKV